MHLTRAQEEIFAAEMLAGESSAFKLVAFLDLDAMLDTSRFAAVVDSVLDHTEPINYKITRTDDGFEQHPLFAQKPSRGTVLESLSAASNSSSEMDRWTENQPSLYEGQKDFPYRSSIGVCSDGSSRWVLCIHHGYADGYAVHKLVAQIEDQYNRPIDSERPTKTAGPVLRDILADEASYKASAAFRDDRSYWEQNSRTLANSIDSNEAATRYDRQPYIASCLIDHATTLGLQNLSRETETAWTAAYTTAVSVAYGRLTGDFQTPISLTTTGRNSPISKDAIAHYSNPLPIDLRINPWDSVEYHLKHTHEASMDTLERQQFRGSDLPNAFLDAQRGNAININFVTFRRSYQFGNTKAHLETLSRGPVSNITAYVERSDSTVLITIAGNAGKYTQDQVDLIAKSVQRNLAGLSGLSPTDCIASLGIQAAGSNVGHEEEPQSVPTLEAALNKVFQENATRPAVVGKDGRWTFSELSATVRSVRDRLEDSGVKAGELVGIFVGHSPQALQSVLAVLAAGACYVPLDPAYPVARLRQMVKASGVSRILIDSDVDRVKLCEVAPNAELLIVNVSSEPTSAELDRSSSTFRRVSEDALCYAMFTSGSTGVPKAVAVPRRAAINYGLRAARTYKGLAGRSLLYSSLSFDISLTALLGTLLAGGEIAIQHFSAETELDQGTASEYTFLKATPTHLSLLPDLPEMFNPTVEFLVAGEQVYGEEIRRWRANNPRVDVVNHYGPSEATCGVLDYRIPAGTDIPDGPVPLGKPFGGASVYLLDCFLEPVDAGAVGEIYISGTCLADGYVRAPALTAERFVPNPWGNAGSRMYRTGDLATYSDEAGYTFVGRSDAQLKIRGHRVEPGEIEAKLVALESVKQACVVPQGSDRAIQLSAHVSLNHSGGSESSAILSYLRSSLPEHLVPSSVTIWPTLPTTINQKTDRARLIASANSKVAEQLTESKSMTEVCGVVAQVLGVESVDESDSLYELGMNSLHALRLAARLATLDGEKLPLSDIYNATNVGELSRKASVRELRNVAPPELNRPTRSALTRGQRRILFEQERASSETPGYNVPYLVKLGPAVDTDKLVSAIDLVVDAHEALRIRLERRNGRVCQYAAHRYASVVEHVYASEETSEDVDELAQILASRHFDLYSELPCKAWIIRTPQNDTYLLFVAHHIAVDGWSFGPFSSDLTKAYNTLQSGQEPVLEGSSFIAIAEEVDAARNTSSMDREYWQATLSGAPSSSTPLSHRASFDSLSGRGSTVNIRVGGTTRTEMIERAERTGASLFMQIHAAFALALWCRGVGTDLVVGTGTSGRSRPEWERTLGFFIETLPIRCRINPRSNTAEFLQHVKETVLAALEHSNATFDDTVAELSAGRSSRYSRVPFQTMSMYRNVPSADLRLSLEGVNYAGQEISIGASKFDLTVSLADSTDPNGDACLEGFIEFSTDGFSRTAAQRLGEVFSSWLEAFSDEETTMSNMRAEIGDEPPFSCVSELLERLARDDPDRVALEGDSELVSYGQLEERTNRIANALRKMGCNEDTTVAVSLPRGPALTLAVIGILKAGGAYVPIDPVYPSSRKQFMIKASGANLGIAWREELKSYFADDRSVLRLGSREGLKVLSNAGASAPRPASHAEKLGVIFTSGSTGEPKGVVLTWTGVGDLIRACRESLGVTTESRVLQHGSPSFDAYLLEIVISVFSGGTLVCPHQDAMILGVDASNAISSLDITHLVMPPSAFATLPVASLPPTTRVILAGESVPARLVSKWEGQRMSNIYGPTECSVYASVEPELVSSKRVTIGKPRYGVDLLLLDEYLDRVPDGQTGEVYLTGPSLAAGYVGATSLTACRFVPNPFGPPGERMYRTGDFAAYGEEGDLVFRGRIDEQVKVRGHRVELGEVSAAIEAFPSVCNAAVVYDSGPEGGALLAAVVADTSNFETEGLRAYLNQVLPSYMIPVRVATLRSFPVTKNGKLDQDELIDLIRTGRSAPYIVDTDDDEILRSLAVVWSRALNGAHIEETTDVFAMGAHSLLAVKVAADVSDLYSAPFTVRHVYENPTVAGQANVIRNLRGA